VSGYTLYDFPRSSASYRVRIALALKGISYSTIAIDLRAGEQRSHDYLDKNPAGLVPALVTPTGDVLTQSLAILRYLDHVAGPKLWPNDPYEQAIVDAMTLTIACDIHPLNNLRVLGYIQNELDAADPAKSEWYGHWVQTGFASLEAQVARHGGTYCYGDHVTAADICLVPQMANACGSYAHERSWAS
jgi:maleylacetoacetate isomerase